MSATRESLAAARNSNRLTDRDAGGAAILIWKFDRYQHWTPAQQQWADDILHRAEAAGVTVETVPPMKIGDGFARVVALLNVAGSRLVLPTITLLDDADQLVAITLIVDKGETVVRRPIKAGSRRGHTLARINKAGEYRETNEMTVAAADLLEKLGNDVTGTALQNARKTGLCCFCNRKLEDERSTRHGYGPICAKTFQLPWSN